MYTAGGPFCKLRTCLVGEDASAGGEQPRSLFLQADHCALLLVT